MRILLFCLIQVVILFAHSNLSTIQGKRERYTNAVRGLFAEIEKNVKQKVPSMKKYVDQYKEAGRAIKKLSKLYNRNWKYERNYDPDTPPALTKKLSDLDEKFQIAYGKFAMNYARTLNKRASVSLNYEMSIRTLSAAYKKDKSDEIAKVLIAALESAKRFCDKEGEKMDFYEDVPYDYRHLLEMKLDTDSILAVRDNVANMRLTLSYYRIALNNLRSEYEFLREHYKHLFADYHQSTD